MFYKTQVSDGLETIITRLRGVEGAFHRWAVDPKTVHDTVKEVADQLEQLKVLVDRETLTSR
jgi:hypothetical protein